MYEGNMRSAELARARESTRLFLERMHSRGVELFVDGKAVLPGDAAARTVREDSPYMADYVFGKNGDIEQVRFDRVRNS